MSFAIFKFSFEVPKAVGILVPHNLRQLNNSLWVWKPYIGLGKKTKYKYQSANLHLTQGDNQ